MGAPSPSEKGDHATDGKPAAQPNGVRAAVVDSSTPLGNGRLTQPQIAKILEKGGDVFGDCYILGAGGPNKDFRATVTVKATIGPTGNVNAVEVTKSTANNPKVDACVAQSFKKVKFPAPSDGATSVITFPITFNGIEAVGNLGGGVTEVFEKLHGQGAVCLVVLGHQHLQRTLGRRRCHVGGPGRRPSRFGG